MPEYFTGRVHSVIFENVSQAFYILKIKVDRDPQQGDEHDFQASAGALITVRGTIPGLHVEVGTWFGFEGNWVRHETYGRQVEITRAPVIRGEWTPKTVKKVLGAHGVGRMTLQVLHERFGDELVEALSDPVMLEDVPGIDQFSAQHIVARWQAVKAMFQALSLLSEFSLPRQKIDQVWITFGDDTERILSDDPWRLVQVDGIDFKQADEIALRMGCDMASPERLIGALLYVMKARRGMGHLYMLTGDLVVAVRDLVGGDLDKAAVAHALKAAHAEGLVVLDRKTRPGIVAVYEPWLYQIEKNSSDLLRERLESARLTDEKAIRSYTKMLGQVGTESAKYAKENPDDVEGTAKAALREWTEGSRVLLQDLQMNAALNALLESVSVITGLPGTGKTFTLRTVVKVLQDAEVPFLLVAPTGIAAKRVWSVTGAEAFTIHRAFQAMGMDMDETRESTYAGIVGASGGMSGADGSAEQWGFDQESPHPAEVIIVDESSMVDQHLLYRILNCTSKKCRVVFVGDAAQLPSVGPGNVLRDLIHSGVCPVTRLTEIYRQEDTSDIVLAAHAINSGQIPTPTPGKTDFSVVEIHSEDRILDTILSTVSKLYGKHANFQVLSPRHAGTLGVTNLNARMRGILNPKQPGLQEMRLGSETIREGDRVMVVKNNYQYEIFNGDVGKIVSLDRKEKEVLVKIWGPPEIVVRLPFKEAPSHLRLAYAMTVHKSQGQEYDVIVMPWVNGFRHQLQRNLIYTAITRARKKVILFGHSTALKKAILNNEVQGRNTLFPERLQFIEERLPQALEA